MARIKEFFEKSYSSTERYWWKQPHAYSGVPEEHAASLMAQQILRYVLGRTPGRAIDLGSGEGADAIRLALLGWEVQAVEPTDAGVDKIRWFATQVGARVRVHKGDILGFVPDGQFDLVICNGVLHYVKDKSAACRKMQMMTVPGGANAIALWSDVTPVPECHRVVPTYPDRERGDVVTAYNGWVKSLLYLERGRIDYSHDDMPPHLHSYIKMIAHKPGCG